MRGASGVRRKAAAVRLVLMDVDGVLTDGGLYYSARGRPMKRFHAHDGYGVVRARNHGLHLAIISGRTSPVVTARARDLRIADVRQGIGNKLAEAHRLFVRFGIRPEEAAFIGDDLFDLELLRAVGLSAAPANALPAVRRAVDVVTAAAGGEGAVREFLDLIIAAQTPHGRHSPTPASQRARSHRVRASR